MVSFGAMKCNTSHLYQVHYTYAVFCNTENFTVYKYWYLSLYDACSVLFMRERIKPVWLCYTFFVDLYLFFFLLNTFDCIHFIFMTRHCNSAYSWYCVNNMATAFQAIWSQKKTKRKKKKKRETVYTFDFNMASWTWNTYKVNFDGTV